MNKTRNNKGLTSQQDQAILDEIIQALYSKQSLSGKDGVITKLIKRAMEVALEGEIDTHMSEASLEEPDNRKNGKTSKTVKSKYGSFELETPRDRANNFEPQLIKKRQTVINNEIDDKILALYSLGNSYADISYHIEDLYGMEVSAAAINSITDRLLEEISEWRSRQLERIYTVVFLDAMFFKARENGTVITKVMYNIRGIDDAGMKDILDFYMCDLWQI